MQGRGLKVIMIWLLLVQSVASLAAPCAMQTLDNDRVSTGRMSNANVSSASASEDSASQDLFDTTTEAARPACHEVAAPAETESKHCDSCSGGLLCATACSIASSVVCSVSIWADIEHAQTQFPTLIQSITSPSSTGLYRPPKTS